MIYKFSDHLPLYLMLNTYPVVFFLFLDDMVMGSVASCFFLAINLYIRAVYQCQKLCLLDLDDDRWWVFFSNLVFLAFMKQ